jgi:hypothetical protein
MKPDSRFLRQPKNFWANVRSLSQNIGYTDSGQIRIPTLEAMVASLESLDLTHSHIIEPDGNPTEFGAMLHEYFSYRARVLNGFVRPKLMSKEQAKREFEVLKARLCPTCPLPMNKQKGDKRAPAYLTGIVNMLIEAGAKGQACDYDPHELTTVTRNGAPLRTLARRVDGAFPSSVNPIAIWEIKEYYYTTTFGSRVADGVYETLLDGMELEELREHEKIDIKHVLMVDDYFTWWECGRSYLCRIIDMLHMGYVDEVLFGYEVIECLPSLVSEWLELLRARPQEPIA